VVSGQFNPFCSEEPGTVNKTPGLFTGLQKTAEQNSKKGILKYKVVIFSTDDVSMSVHKRFWKAFGLGMFKYP